MQSLPKTGKETDTGPGRRSGPLIHLRDIIFPPTCAACNLPVTSENGLCSRCHETIYSITSPVCPVCGIPFVSKSGQDHICSSCILTPPKFDIHRSLFAYHGAIKELILRFKYKYDFYAFKVLGDISNSLAEKLGDTLDADFVVPVPLHKKRLLTRGFNQSLLIARALFPKTKILTGLLTRKKNTPYQSTLNRTQRIENMSDAFAISPSRKITGKDILLVDDISTTGSTIDACCRELLSLHPSSIKVFTIARTLNNNISQEI